MKYPDWIRNFLWMQTYHLQMKKPALAIQKTSAWLIIFDARDAHQLQTAQLLKTQIYPRVCRCIAFEPERVEEWFIPLWESQLDMRWQAPPNVKGVVADNHYAYLIQLCPEPHPSMKSLEILAPVTYRVAINPAKELPLYHLTCRWTEACSAAEASKRIVNQIEKYIRL
jgi:hypothetical protein